jgi:hypothetical protein
MLVLIATNELQGTAPGDYAWTVEGELVTPVATECAEGERCGCNRGFPGLASGMATTTAMVVERPGVTEADLRDAVHDWLERGGWIELLEQTGMSDPDEIDSIVNAVIDEHLDMILEVCDAYPEGTVVTRFGQFVAARSHPFAA